MSQSALAPAPLRGRERECAELADVVAGTTRAAVALVHGEPGIGKTTLLQWTVAVARARSTAVLSTSGVPTEQHLPFAGLRRLLRASPPDDAVPPELAAHLPLVEEALAAPGSAGAGLTRTAMAVLDLLADVASNRGLLVAVDDVQWLDGPSRDVVAFIGRRLGTEPVRVVLATRDEVPPGVAQAALAGRWRTLPLDRLDERSAADLLDRASPGLPGAVRRRVLDEADGLPLALRELPAAVLDDAELDRDRAATPSTIAGRIEEGFANRLARLPPTTQLLLLLAAVHDSDEVEELLPAAAAARATPVTAQDLEPAVAAVLVEPAAGRVAFVHSLARSAALRRAGPAAVRAAHRVLATTARTADRRTWHAAAAADSPDEDVAEQLERAAERALHAGAAEIASHAYDEAVRLSVDPPRRAGRQLRTLELLADVGRTDRALELLDSLDIALLDDAGRVRADWLREALTDSSWTGGDRVRTFVAIARRMHVAGDTGRAAELLLSISLRCWWSNLDPDTSRSVAAAADSLEASIGTPTHLVIAALADPVERGAQSLAALDRVALLDLYPDAGLLLMLALAATGIGDHPRAVDIFAASITESRRQARESALANALTSLAWCEVHLGRPLRAEAAADEGVQRSRAVSHPLWEATGELALAASRGVRGDVGAATALADRAERVLLGAGANPMLGLVRAARGLTALAGRDPAEAYAQLIRVFTEGDTSYHQHLRTFLVAELAEAAAHSGQGAAARAVLAPMEALAARTGSPVLRAGLLVARPLLADGEEAEEHYRGALDDGLAPWPMHRGRVLLEYGAWLRRHRRISEAREPLRVAHETFTGLSATPWAERAAHELRAAGDAPTDRPAAAWEHLTSQELQIATLAAQGLTNRQIGDRLLLSHRTVSTHLYHTFPKLGISARAQLATALADLVDGRGGAPDDRPS